MKETLFPLILLAGGLATRLKPLSETIPKSLVLIDGKPFIDYQLDLIKKNNIKKVIICVGHLGQKIIDYLKLKYTSQLEIDFVFDGPTLLGTAGAIKKALPKVEDYFFVLNGDSYLPCNFETVQNTFLSENKLGLMTIFKNNNRWDKSNIDFKNKTIIRYDKLDPTPSMQYIDYGLSIYSKAAFNFINENEKYDLANLNQELIQKNELASHEIKNRFYEIGSFKGIDDFHEYIKK